MTACAEARDQYDRAPCGSPQDSAVLSLAAKPSVRFPLLGATHIAIVGGVLLFAGALTALQRTVLRGSAALRLGLGTLLLLETLSWYGYLLRIHQVTFPAHLPLELCDVTLLLVLVELFTLNAALFDICYYLGLAGSSMALLTPNLWEPFPSLSTGQFFFAHGLVVAAVLYLVWSGLAQPRPGSVGRAMLALNVWAMVAGCFDWLFKTNYMYLRHKPEQSSLLNVLGPWPWYIAGGEAVALAIFLLLYLPFRHVPASAPASD